MDQARLFDMGDEGIDLQGLARRAIFRCTEAIVWKAFQENIGYTLQRILNNNTRVTLLTYSVFIASGRLDWKQLLYAVKRHDNELMGHLMTRPSKRVFSERRPCTLLRHHGQLIYLMMASRTKAASSGTLGS